MGIETGDEPDTPPYREDRYMMTSDYWESIAASFDIPSDVVMTARGLRCMDGDISDSHCSSFRFPGTSPEGFSV